MQLRAVQPLPRPSSGRPVDWPPRSARVLRPTAMTTPKGLSRIPLSVLEQLLSAVERSRLECPFSNADLIDAGFKGRTADVVDALGDVDRSAVVVALRIAIAERVHRPPPRLDLVWTGPETLSSVSRGTSFVVERLFAEAQRTVIVCGYTF